MQDAKSDSPGVLVFPPALFGGTLLMALVVQWLWPRHLGLPVWLRITVGVLGVAAAAFLGLSGERALHDAGTNVRPSLPTTAIVTSGPYRYTRNPLYLALLCLYLCVTVAVNTVWPLILLVPLLLVLDYGIIRREERYLEAKFGEPYRAYKAQVRRWI